MDTQNLAGTDPETTLLAIDPGTRLPVECFACGGSATRMATAKASNETGGERVARVGGIFGMLAGGFSMPLVLLRGLLPRRPENAPAVSFKLKLPTCEACHARGKRPSIESFDEGERKVRVLVHRKFRDACEAANR